MLEFDVTMPTMITWCFLVLAPFIRLVTGEPEFCGVPDGVFSDRVVEGTDASPGEFPWMVKLTTINHLTFCGGSLIADRYVLTAGHCMVTYIQGMPAESAALREDIVHYEIKKPSDVIVEVSAYQTKLDGIPHLARQIILHPDYYVFNSEGALINVNDIALIKIDPVVFSTVAIPICLPNPGVRADDQDGMTVMLAGWCPNVIDESEYGSIRRTPDFLNKVALKIVSLETCSKIPTVRMHFRDANRITVNNTLCLTSDDAATCHGDSGGPAFVVTSSGVVIIGIMSWSVDGNHPNDPLFYTRVSNYVAFIGENTKDGIFLPEISFN